jgi:hypothetical protein
MEIVLARDAADTAITVVKRVVGLAAILHRLHLSADMTDKKGRDILQSQKVEEHSFEED